MHKATDDVMIVQARRSTAASRSASTPASTSTSILPDGDEQRSFSFATAPHANDEIELQIRLIPGGKFTTHVFNEMKVGDTVRFEGPLGSFFLREDSDKPIIFVAGATGFAPVKSMVEHAFHIGDEAPDHPVLGRALARRDLYLPDLPQQWARRASEFHVRAGAVDAAARGSLDRPHRASCTRRSSPTSPISPAIRSTPAAR